MKNFFLFFFLFSTISLASAETLNIGDYHTAVGSEVIVPVTINGSGLIAGGVVNISFDPSIISVKNAVAGDFGNPVANMAGLNLWQYDLIM